MVSSIEAPLALLREPIEVLLLEAIKLTQMSFSLVPKVLYAVDVIVFVSKELTVVDPLMEKARNIQGIVGFESVSIHHTIQLNTFLYDCQKSHPLSVRSCSRVELATALEQSEGSYFNCSATISHFFSSTTKIALIHFYLSTVFMFIPVKLRGYQSYQTHEEPNGRVGLNPHKFSRCLGCYASHKVFYQPSLLS